MTLQSVEALTTADLPQAHRLIIAAASKGLPIRAKGHGPNPAGMALQDAKAHAAADFPQAYPLIPPAGKGLPIGGKTKTMDALSDTLALRQHFARLPILYRDGRFYAGAGQQLFIRR